MEWIRSQTLYPDPEEPTCFDVLEESGRNGAAPFYYCVVAENEENKSLVGFALCTYNYAVWLGKSLLLESIYVEREYRLHGIGRRLLSAVCEHGLKKECVQINYYTHNKDDGSREFFNKIGGTSQTESEGWLVYSVPRNNIISNSVLVLAEKDGKTISTGHQHTPTLLFTIA